MTRGQVLRYAIAFALRRARKIVRGAKTEMTEPEGYAIADHVVDQLMQRGDPWGLKEEAEVMPPHSTGAAVSYVARGDFSTPQ